MLTTALNKSPKPEIIVDDIIVNELNLGSQPPELEILEVGDLAEDRFRGIFKMSYKGDAYLTLKTRVQANPLNTYLSTKPSFVSPCPLAASSGLTIPLQITLSDIRLSGFVILVFSRQKGITLVFRNDPLESLKVSSTFDSIPFVRDYLQKTIEAQLRVLFMEDLPAIIHRLSLRRFNSDYQAAEDHAANQSSKGGEGVDPFASSSGFSGDTTIDGMPLPFDQQPDTYASFSTKSLLRLAALTESQRTLSLFTPSISDTVYRAWASATERGFSTNTYAQPYRPPTLSRIQSTLGVQDMTPATPSFTSDSASHSTRPSLASFASTGSIYSLGSAGPRSRAGKKRKNRVVNLRKTALEKDSGDTASVSTGYPESASGSRSAEQSSVIATEPTSATESQEREGELTAPPLSPEKKAVPLQQRRADRDSTVRRRPAVPREPLSASISDDIDRTPRASAYLPAQRPPEAAPLQRPTSSSRKQRPPPTQDLAGPSKGDSVPTSLSGLKLNELVSPPSSETAGSSGGILEQAWLMKMTHEIARKVAEEKANGGEQGIWKPSHMSDEEYMASQSHRDEAPPPAYGL